MSRAIKITFFICSLWLVGETLNAWSPRLLGPLIIPGVLAYAVMWLTSLVWVFKRWRTFHFQAVVPLLACIFTAVVYSIIAQPVRNAGFSRVWPRYEAIIHRIETGELVVSTNTVNLPVSWQDRKLAFAIKAQRDASGVLTVEFFIGGDFPPKTWGYLYCSSDEIGAAPPDRMDWTGARRLRPKWFYVWGFG
jgi:hypothetical protein